MVDNSQVMQSNRMHVLRMRVKLASILNSLKGSMRRC